MTDSRERPAVMPLQLGESDSFLSVGKLPAAPGAQPDDSLSSAMPDEFEKVEKKIGDALNDIMRELGERGLGGPWDSEGDFKDHTIRKLNRRRDKCRDRLPAHLAEWSKGSDPIRVLMCVWRESSALWENCLIYRTLWAVEQATSVFAEAVAPLGAGRPHEDWQTEALHAVGCGMRLLTADAEVFKQINLSSARDLAGAADEAVRTTSEVQKKVRSALTTLDSRSGEPGDGSDRAVESLGEIEIAATEANRFYRSISLAAKALFQFENWLTVAPRLGSAAPVSGPSGAAALQRVVLDSVDEAIDDLRDAQTSLKQFLSEAEPWEQLLAEIRNIVEPPDASGTVEVFVPKRTSIRYCYPFAVEADDRESLKNPGHLHASLKAALEGALGAGYIRVHEPRPLEPTEFFAAQDSKTRLYDGYQIKLSDIEIWYGPSPGAGDDGQRERCRVWIDLSLMGNHCLCIEPAEPTEVPLPHLLYRALRAGTPFTLGATATVVKPPAGKEVAWDNMHLFSRDILRAVARAGFWKQARSGKTKGGSSSEPQFARGNLHEIVIVRTANALGIQLGKIENKLDRAVGGRILMRSIQRTATTFEEWVRYPPVQRTERRDREYAFSSVSEMGLGGDWFSPTGETTIFGIVTAPNWHSDVYAEAAQFANSWSPRLRLWSKRLQSVGQDPESHCDKESKYANTLHKNVAHRAEELRTVEHRIRRHLAQIWSEELCATLAHRRFLDQLLKTAGVGRLQRDVEAQLESAEHLTDWFDERALRSADHRRDALLFFIALFGLFELATFMGLANDTQLHEKLLFVTLHKGVWEDWVVLLLFLLSLLAGIGYFVLNPLVRRLRKASRRKRGLVSSGRRNRGITW